MRLWRSVAHAETKHFRVWLAVLSLLCFTFSGEVSAAQDQVDAPTYRIAAGDSRDALYAYLSEVQVDHLEMARSDAFKKIVDRALELAKGRT